jgi:hypothetical protein
LFLVIIQSIAIFFCHPLKFINTEREADETDSVAKSGTFNSKVSPFHLLDPFNFWKKSVKKAHALEDDWRSFNFIGRMAFY